MEFQKKWYNPNCLSLDLRYLQVLEVPYHSLARWRYYVSWTDYSRNLSRFSWFTLLFTAYGNRRAYFLSRYNSIDGDNVFNYGNINSSIIEVCSCYRLFISSANNFNVNSHHICLNLRKSTKSIELLNCPILLIIFKERRWRNIFNPSEKLGA